MVRRQDGESMSLAMEHEDIEAADSMSLCEVVGGFGACEARAADPAEYCSILGSQVKRIHRTMLWLF